MKKFLNISVLSLALGIAVTACAPTEVDDIFDENAADRLEASIKTYSDLLTAQGGKWAMEYVANEDEPGYVYLFTFNKNGSVTISGDNKWITKLTNPSSREATYASETSMWEVITDNGPVLSFNTYNRIFHLFANPEDIPDESDDDGNEQGYGHSGDYEFDLMRYSGDTLYLTGKKYEMPIVMYRIPSDTDDQEYMTEIDDMINSVKLTVFPDLLMTGSNGKEYYVNNLSTQVVDFYRHDPNDTTLKKVDTQVTANCIATKEGFRFINPVWLLDDIQETKTLCVQHFKLQEDGSFLCTDDNVTTITCLPLDQIFENVRTIANTKNNWQMDPTDLGGRFATVYAEVVAGCKSVFKRNFSYFRFYYDFNTKQYVLGFRDQNSNGVFYMSALAISNASPASASFRFTFTDEGDTNGNLHRQRVPAFQSFIDLLAANSFTVTSPSAFNPMRLKFTSDANAEDYFYVDIKTSRP